MSEIIDQLSWEQFKKYSEKQKKPIKKITKKKPKIKVRKVCEHKEIEQGESYYGHESHQYTTWWYCLDCGKEVSQ